MRDASSRESLVLACYHEEWNGVRVGSFILEKFSSREVSKIHKYVLIFLFLCLYGALRKLRKIAIFWNYGLSIIRIFQRQSLIENVLPLMIYFKDHPFSLRKIDPNIQCYLIEYIQIYSISRECQKGLMHDRRLSIN